MRFQIKKRLFETDAEVASPELAPNDVRRYFQSIKEQALSATFGLKQKIIPLFAHQIIVDCEKTTIKAYLPNPLPGEFPARSSAHNEEEVSTTSQSSAYGGRNVYTFEIKLDLSKPGQILINDGVVEKEDIRLAA